MDPLRVVPRTLTELTPRQWEAPKSQKRTKRTLIRGPESRGFAALALPKPLKQCLFRHYLGQIPSNEDPALVTESEIYIPIYSAAGGVLGGQDRHEPTEGLGMAEGGQGNLSHGGT